MAISAPAFTLARASSATRINASGFIETIASNLPRWDYDPASLVLRGLRVEEGSTNLLLDSRDLMTTWDVNAVTVTANADTSMDGTVNATSIADNSAIVVGRRGQNVGVAADTTTVYCFSVYIKKTGAPSFYPAIATNLGNLRVAILNTQTGTVAFAANANIIAVGTIDAGAYWRLYIAAKNENSSSCGCNLYPSWNLDGATAANVLPTGTTIFDRAQLEVGSFPTSYIPTVASQVSRVADILTANTAGFLTASRGTIWGEAIPSGAGSAEKILMQLDDGTQSNRINLARTTGGAYKSEVFSGGASVDSKTSGAWALLAKKKFALAYALNDFAISIDGGAAITSASGTPPASLPTIRAGNNATPNSSFNGWLSRLRYYNARLANADLQLITA